MKMGLRMVIYGVRHAHLLGAKDTNVNSYLCMHVLPAYCVICALTPLWPAPLFFVLEALHCSVLVTIVKFIHVYPFACFG